MHQLTRHFRSGNLKKILRRGTAPSPDIIPGRRRKAPPQPPSSAP